MTKIQQQLPLARYAPRRKRRPVVSMADLVEGQGSRGTKPRGFVIRFWESVRKSETNECWEWTGMIMDSGYGGISIANRTHLAHRISFLIEHGRLDPEKLVMHSCDNRRCVNPKHLSQGTDADNIGDAWLKGRLQKGERNGMSKLEERDVINIRKLYNSGSATMNQLADRYGVWVPCIWRIIRNLRWKHLV